MLVFIRTFVFLLFVHLCIEGADEQTCYLYNYGELNITFEEEQEEVSSSTGDNETFDAGSTILVECAVDGFQFVNGVRRTTGVDVFSLDQGAGLSLTCSGSTGRFSPDITKDTNGDLRVIYCDEGCAPFREDHYDVTYPASIVTIEENSPPLVYNNFMSITLACQAGYSKPVGDVGKDSLLCEKDSSSGAVAWSTDSTIQCIPGCPDVTGDVTDGLTTDEPSSTTGAAPFSPGDTVSFLCDPGYTLVGYSKLTCTGANEWSENTPECVYVSA